MDIMSFVAGYNAGASQKGGSVSQAELEAAIKKVVPAWALEETPPQDAVTAVSTHNADQTAHPYLSGRVATALDRISGHDTNIEEINTSVAERLKTADLAAKLDAYKAAQGLVSNTTSNMTNYYLKSEIYTKEEVAALISAIPKFEIKVVSSLPTSNISLTTVYLVKDTTEGGGLYTEYIYVNGAWEELGSQTVDLSGYITDEELDNLLKDYATLTKVSELIADALKPYATEEEITEAIRVATVNFVTGAQVTTAINNALNAYYTSAQVDAEIAAQIKTALSLYITREDADKTYQPAGDYLTPTTGDQRYPAKQTTEDTLTEHSEKIADLEEALANSMVEYAESVEWLEAYGDKDRTYYLPDGYEYTYRAKVVNVIYNANTADGDHGRLVDQFPGGSYGDGYPAAKDGVLTSALIPIDPTQMSPDATKREDSEVAIAYESESGEVIKLYPLHSGSSIWTDYYKANGTRLMVNKGSTMVGIDTDGEITLPTDGLTYQLCNPAHFAASNWIDVAGVRISIGVNPNGKVTEEQLNKFKFLIDYGEKEVYGWYSTGKLHSDDPAVQENAKNITDLQERMTAAEEKIASGVTGPLFAKLGLIGDSLTNQEYQGWQAITVSMLGNPEWHKNAITGSSVANYGDGRETNYTPFVDRYLNTPADCDCIVIMGGTNDATYQYSYDMGTVGVLADNTFKGAYSTIIEGLLTRNPATRLILMVPPRFYNVSDSSLNANIGKYAEAVREIAKHYALPCLDFFDLLGQNKCTAEWASWDWANNDPIHFSNAIAPRVGRMVANFIRQYY